jgi:hypothetical protein
VNWDKVQKDAKDAGRLVFAMDQGQTAVMTQPGPWGNAYSGFCAGLAVHWIALRYSGRDFAYDKKTRVCEMPDWRTTMNQNQYEDVDDDNVVKLAAPFANYGLFINMGRVTRLSRALTGRDLRKVGVANEGCYYISLKRSGGGHAVAMQRAAGHDWRFFDANYGEFKVGGRHDFDDFIDWYMDATGYKTRYTASTQIIGIDPPPYINPTALQSKTMGTGAPE